MEVIFLYTRGKNSKMIATETTEDTEGKYSVLSVYVLGSKNYTLYSIQI